MCGIDRHIFVTGCGNGKADENAAVSAEEKTAGDTQVKRRTASGRAVVPEETESETEQIVPEETEQSCQKRRNRRQSGSQQKRTVQKQSGAEPAQTETQKQKKS